MYSYDYHCVYSYYYYYHHSFVNKLCELVPELMGGSADLTPSNLTKFKVVLLGPFFLNYDYCCWCQLVNSANWCIISSAVQPTSRPQTSLR